MTPPQLGTARAFTGLAFVIEGIALTWLAAHGTLAVPTLLAGYLVSFVAYLVLLGAAGRAKLPSWIWFLLALLLRAPWIPSQPSLSDDVWRYLHDGRAQVAGVNPYRYPPADPQAKDYRGPEYTKINHPELPTIYPPAAQLAFRLAAYGGATLVGWKIVVLLFDLVLGVAVMLLLRARKLPHWRAAIYLLHPLPVIEFAGNGHIDVLAIAGLVLCLALVETQRWSAGIAYAVSVATKYLALPLLPFLARDTLGGRRRLFVIAAAGASLALLYLPFADYWSLGSLGAFARSFEFNGPVYLVLARVTPPLTARAIVAVVLMGLLALAWQQRATGEAAAFGFIGAVLLLSPIVHPWYVVWLVPFLAWRFHLWVLVWSGTVVAAYLVLPAWRAAGIWELPAGVMLAEYGPVYVLLAFSVSRYLRGQKTATNLK